MSVEPLADDVALPDPASAPIDALLRRSWHPVAVDADVGTEPVSVTLLGERLVLFRGRDGEVTAFHDVCVHRGSSLALGWEDDGCLVCPFHGWTYDGDGACVRIPSQKDRPIPRRARLHSYPTTTRLGHVWVCLDDEPIVDPPAFSAEEHDDMRVVVCPPYDWRCHALRRLENFLDFSHFAWVHPGILGDRAHPEVPAHDVWVDDDRMRVRQPRPEPKLGVKNADVDPADLTEDGRVLTTMHYTGYPPLAAELHQELPAGRRYAVLIAPSPVDERTTRTFWLVARNYDLDQPDETFVRFQEDVVEQDRPIVESQRPERIPADITAELHVLDDKVSLTWRRLLADLGRRALDRER